MNTEQRARVRALNDALRQGCGSGRLQVTHGVISLGADGMRQALETVASFSSFDADNDPHGEHDFGTFQIAGRQLFFKIDYFDANLEAGAADPSDESTCVRVLTVMLADEY